MLTALGITAFVLAVGWGLLVLLGALVTALLSAAFLVLMGGLGLGTVKAVKLDREARAKGYLTKRERALYLLQVAQQRREPPR